jgi:membrane protein implicated in regulation of membrane protease activity
MEAFEQLDPLLKTFWFIAIPASLIFLLQTIMTFLGADAGDGVQADFDGDFSGDDAPFQLFSFRNLINFLLGVGWTGISFYSTITSPPLLIAVSVIVGILFVYLFFVIIQQVEKLAENNTFKISSALGKTGEVYLNIPGHKQGKGKIMISVNGAFHELDAMTNNASLPSGTVVKVVSIENNNILIVETP